MKYLLVFLMMFSASLFAMERGWETRSGTSITTATGTVKGVVNYSSESMKQAGWFFSGSEKYDSIDGKQKVSGTFASVDNSAYSSFGGYLNASNFEVKNTTGSYVSNSNFDIKTVENGYGYESTFAPGSSTFDEYASRFVTNTNEVTTTNETYAAKDIKWNF